jgi:hypothetical protein
MGMSEDDRIRNKNRLINMAYDIYDSLKAKNKTNSDIHFIVSELLRISSDENRNKIYLTVLNLVRRLDEGNSSI